MTNGLHSCKPGNEPTVGETKHFTIEQRIGKSGKPWTKIKADREGQPYRVVSVKPTDFKDDHGNVSMNIEIEPQNGAPERQAAVQRTFTPPMGDDRSNRIERQHSQEMALRYMELKGLKNLSFPEIIMLIDWFQRDVGRMPAPPEAKVEPVVEPDEAPEHSEEESF